MRSPKLGYSKNNEDMPLLADGDTKERLVEKRDIRMSYKKMPVFWCCFQLLSAFTMGLLINAFSNGDLIKKNLAFRLGYTTSLENTTLGDLPKEIWSLGCFFPIGGLFGSFLSGWAVQKWGRKCTTMFLCFIIFIGSALKIVSYYKFGYLLIVGRFFDGIGAAGLMVSSVLHMFECLPEQLHNVFKPLIQVSVNLGILAQNMLQLNMVCRGSYQYTFLSSVGTGLLLMISTFFLPESPIYLSDVKKDEKATLEAYVSLRGSNASEYMQLVTVKKTTDPKDGENNISVFQLFTTRRFVGPLIATIVCHIAQQLSGINAVVAFSSSYLAGVGLDNPDVAALLVIGMGLIGSIIFSPCVSRFRRKLSLLIGHIGILISLVGLVATTNFNLNPYYKVVFMGFFVFVFQFGPGPMVWFLPLEVFPSNAHGAAQSVCSTFNWMANAIVYSIADYGIIALYIFTGVNVFVIAFLSFFFVETLNKDSNEIQNEYAKKFKCCM